MPYQLRPISCRVTSTSAHLDVVACVVRIFWSLLCDLTTSVVSCWLRHSLQILYCLFFGAYRGMYLLAMKCSQLVYSVGFECMKQLSPYSYYSMGSLFQTDYTAFVTLLLVPQIEREFCLGESFKTVAATLMYLPWVQEQFYSVEANQAVTFATPTILGGV